MRARSLPLVLLLFLPQFVLASNTQAEKPRTAEEPPDAELLEFIAEFEPLDGQWIDPIQLNMIFADSREGKEND